jgi:flagellar hook-associated protein 2
LDARETAYEQQLTRQFSVMSSRVATIKATQSYMDQQIKLWTKSDG